MMTLLRDFRKKVGYSISRETAARKEAGRELRELYHLMKAVYRIRTSAVPAPRERDG